jgi:hypothetical protein
MRVGYTKKHRYINRLLYKVVIKTKYTYRVSYKGSPYLYKVLVVERDSYGSEFA